MDRRFFSFILSSTAFFLIYASLRIMFLPPPVPPEVADLAPLPPAAESLDVASADPLSLAETDPDAVPNVAAADADAVPERPTRPQWRTLGSMDPATGHVMLITINTRGGGVERIELTERKENGRLKYRRVDIQSGYLGYFAADPTATEMGVRINVVGPGTPAALAKPSQTDPNQTEPNQTEVVDGLQVGDVIIGARGETITNLADLEQALQGTKPGQSVTLEVIRGEREASAAEGDGGTVAVQAATGKRLTFTAKLTEHPLDLVRLSDAGGEDEVKGNVSRLSCLLSVSAIGRNSRIGNEPFLNGADPADLIWTIVESAPADGAGAESIELELRVNDAELQTSGGRAFAMRRAYTLTPGSYLVDMDWELQNVSDSPQSLAYRLEGVNGVTLEGWWYSNKISPNWGGSAARDVIYQTPLEGHQLISGYGLLKKARDVSQPYGETLFVPASPLPERQLDYIAVDAQYFVVGYVPPESSDYLDYFGRATAMLVAEPELIERHKERAVNTSFFLDSAVEEISPGQSLKRSLRMFAGPKQPELLASVGMGQAIYYGWFSWPAMLLGHLLHLLAGVGNYAAAIVLLTLVVRGAMFPLSRKAAINAQRMQELAPELKKIADKYKDDMEGRLKAQRELQQRVGFNPLAGCLPVFLQLPIFMGLYRTLSVDIELRQAAFASWTTWASNLAAPDMATYWGDWLWGYLSGRGTGWLGPYFNVLPMIVVALFLIQQKLFMPPATDEQTALQQKMMNYMTLIMGLFFFRVPAGLCIYFITSSLWGISERILVKRTLPKTPHFDKSVLEGKVVKSGSSPSDEGGGQTTTKRNVDPRPSGGNGSATTTDGDSWTDRLRKRLTNEQPPAPLPKDRKRPTTVKPGKKRR